MRPPTSSRRSSWLAEPRRRWRYGGSGCSSRRRTSPRTQPSTSAYPGTVPSSWAHKSTCSWCRSFGMNDVGPRGLAARPNLSLPAERLDLGNADLLRQWTRGRAVGRRSRVVILLAGVERPTSALARHDDDAKMRRLYRGDRERAQVELRGNRPEGTTGERVPRAGVDGGVAAVLRAVRQCRVAGLDEEGP